MQPVKAGITQAGGVSSGAGPERIGEERGYTEGHSTHSAARYDGVPEEEEV